MARRLAASHRVEQPRTLGDVGAGGHRRRAEAVRPHRPADARRRVRDVVGPDRAPCDEDDDCREGTEGHDREQ